MNAFLALVRIACFWPLLASPLGAAAAKPPNVIVIFADDISSDAFGCYGNKEIVTPNIDRMAKEGVFLKTFYVTPLCHPSRVALMTGLYGFHTDTLGMKDAAYKPAKDDPRSDISNLFTLGDLMKSAGYATALSGKWQLSGELPTLIYDSGFDAYRMWAYKRNLPDGANPPSDTRGGKTSRYWQPWIVENGKYVPTKPTDFGPDMFCDFVIDFALQQRKEPFFIYWTDVLAHSPRVETPDPAHPGQRKPANFKSEVEYLDHNVGRLLDALRKHGLAQNTVVIFMADNGTGKLEDDSGAKNKVKGTVTEDGVHVPCIMWGAGVKPQGASPALGDLTDIMPTLAQLSGATLPKNIPFDGKSLVPVMTGASTKGRDWIYSFLDDGRLLRDERWLLQLPMGGGQPHFFDCGTSRDGTGYKDVSGSKDPEVAAARARMEAILSQMPEPKPRALTDREKRKDEKKKDKMKDSDD